MQFIIDQQLNLIIEPKVGIFLTTLLDEAQGLTQEFFEPNLEQIKKDFITSSNIHLRLFDDSFLFIYQLMTKKKPVTMVRNKQGLIGQDIL